MNLKPNPEISQHKRVVHGGPFLGPMKPGILDYSSNINPIGPPPQVRKTLKKLDSIAIYPDSDSTYLRKKLQNYTKIPFTQTVVGNGATEIIYNFCDAFLSKNTPILIPVPTFGEYEAACKLSGAKISYFKTMNLNDDLDDFIEKIPSKGCIFVCNPNNPTGKIISKKNLAKIIFGAHKKQTLTFVDECFVELVPDYNESIISLVKKFRNLFVLRSLTKSFGLAGIRVGYGVGSKQMISILNEIKIPWNVSNLAQQAGISALNDLSYLEKSKKIIRQESAFLRNQISKINGFECHDTSTNFILIKTKIKSKTLQQKLLKKKILIRDCSSFRGLNDNFIRIAVRTRKENKKLIKALVTL